MRLRQVALAAAELAPARESLFELLGLTEDYKDPGVGEFGLENSVMAIGDTFLEIVAPTQADTAAGRTLSRMGTDACGYMALFQVDDFSSFEQHLNQTGVRQVWSTQRDEVSACHVHPKDIGGAIVSFDEMRPSEDWLWAGPRWRSQQASAVDRILGITLGSPDPSALFHKWVNVLGEGQLASATVDPVNRHISFHDGTFAEFVPNPDNEALQRITFATGQPERLYAKAEQIGLGKAGDTRIGQLQISFTSE